MSDKHQPAGPRVGEALATAGGQSIAPVQSSIPLPELEVQLAKPRALFSATLSVITAIMAILAMIPLFSVLYMLLFQGGQRLGVALFTELPPAIGMAGGGIGNALLGTISTVVIAAIFSVPFGIMAAVYTAEFAPESRVASGVRFCAKVLTGLPSVLAGLFIYAAVVAVFRQYSALAGGLALAVLMLPTIFLTAESAIKMVPVRMKEAAIGMGATPTQVVWQVVLPTALPGLLTGVMLAVARATGETAPLLFTALYSSYWPTGNLFEPTATLAVLIYNNSQSPEQNQQLIAWSASLVLVFMVLMLNIAAQIWGKRATVR
jgi:phosphate transport system permease protein